MLSSDFVWKGVHLLVLSSDACDLSLALDRLTPSMPREKAQNLQRLLPHSRDPRVRKSWGRGGGGER